MAATANSSRVTAGRPAVATGLGEGVDEGQETTGGGQRPGDVVAVPDRVPALGDEPRGRQGRSDGDGDVDEQRPTPRGVLRQDTAENEADGGTAPGDPAVDAEGPRPLLRLGEGDREQGERRGCHDRGERTLQGPRAEQHGRALGQPAQSRGARESQQADDEHPFATQVVGDAPPQEQEAGEGQGVRRQHPLAIGGGDVKRPLGRGKGDDHHRCVEDDHQLRHRDDPQGAETLRVGRSRGWRRGVVPFECGGHRPSWVVHSGCSGDTVSHRPPSGRIIGVLVPFRLYGMKVPFVNGGRKSLMEPLHAPDAAGERAPAEEPLRPLRADAQRNRARVLEAAEAVFAAEGINVPVDVIAEKAGVGIGTLYRHFPTKEKLFEAILIGRIADVTVGRAGTSRLGRPGERLLRISRGPGRRDVVQARPDSGAARRGRRGRRGGGRDQAGTRGGRR